MRLEAQIFNPERIIGISVPGNMRILEEGDNLVVEWYLKDNSWLKDRTIRITFLQFDDKLSDWCKQSEKGTYILDSKPYSHGCRSKTSRILRWIANGGDA